MAHIIAVTGSVTSAARLTKELERAGCMDAKVVHTPVYFNKGGCSYSVKTKDYSLDLVRQTAQRIGIPLKQIFWEERRSGERVYNDIS